MSEDEKFDLALREKLKDAEVKAPSGVWRAVSSRLDDIEGIAGAKTGDSSRLWLWVGSGLAIASLALALVFTGTFVKKAPEQQLARLVETPEQQASTFVEWPELKELPSLPSLPARPLVASAGEPESSGSEPVGAEEQVFVDTESSSAVPETTENGSAARGEAYSAPSIRDAGFVAPMPEKKNRGGFGSYVSGTVSGNAGTNRQTSYTSGSPEISSSDYIQETGSSVYGIPFSIGLGARYHFNEKLSVSAGLDYSLLTRSFSGRYLPEGASSGIQGDAYHYVHYLGIPVNVYYNFLETSILRFYGFAGGEIEFCLASKYRFHTASDEYYISEKVTNPLFSVRMGVGIEFKVSKLVGIYLDPGAYYCFYSQQPKSLRTERPFNFNFNAGVRFNF